MFPFPRHAFPFRVSTRSISIRPRFPLLPRAFRRAAPNENAKFMGIGRGVPRNSINLISLSCFDVRRTKKEAKNREGTGREGGDEMRREGKGKNLTNSSWRMTLSRSDVRQRNSPEMKSIGPLPSVFLRTESNIFSAIYLTTRRLQPFSPVPRLFRLFSVFIRPRSQTLIARYKFLRPPLSVDTGQVYGRRLKLNF